MKKTNQYQPRREFLKICGTMVAAAAAGHISPASATTPYRTYERVRLMFRGKPMGVGDFAEGESFIFNYPYVTTPCMIMNLGKGTNPLELATEQGNNYVWQGGIGPHKSIVSYSAICAHRMTYTAKAASFINYRHSTVVYFDEEQKKRERAQIIYCCSERSIYDPAKGAQVIGGPAPQPLASISLLHNEESDSIYAVGTSGGEMFSQFLDKFEFRLQLDHKITNISQLTSGEVNVLPIAEYSETLVYC